LNVNLISKRNMDQRRRPLLKGLDIDTTLVNLRLLICLKKNMLNSLNKINKPRKFMIKIKQDHRIMKKLKYLNYM